MNTIRNTFIALIGVVIVIIGGVLIWQKSDTAGNNPGNGSATTTPGTGGTASDMTIYSNSDYGFSFSYPKSFSVAVQNYADTAGRKTLVSLKNADSSQIIRVTALIDAKTGKPVPPFSPDYEKAVVAATIFDGSGASPKSFGEFQLRTLGDARFAYIKTGLFEGVLGVSYYAAVPGGVAEFSLVSQGVDWTNPDLDIEQDAGHLALKSMLATFKVGASAAGAAPVTYVPYSDASGAFSLNAPAGWTVNKNFSYTALGPSIALKGAAFMIPAAFTAATNLSSDSYISVEKNPGAKSCIADEFVSTGSTLDPKSVTIGGIAWNAGESADTAAGNYYNEIVYAAKHGSDCYGVRLFMHSGNIANYGAGARQQFDKAALVAIHQAVVASFKFTK